MFAVDSITAHRYDPAADALYLTFASAGSPKIVRSVEVTPEIVADVDDHRRIVGLEVLYPALNAPIAQQWLRTQHLAVFLDSAWWRRPLD